MMFKFNRNIFNFDYFLVFGLLGVLVFLLMNIFSSCSQMAMGTVQSVVGTSYLSEDEDILAVERAYVRMEDELGRRINNIDNEYPDYDEYRYSVDEIGHNPYALISYLTAKYVSFTPAEMQADDIEKEVKCYGFRGI